MRRRPLRKISCHPFLKIFVNLVSSVCGFISTCINVSSLVTEPQYLGEDIIKNVFGPWGGGAKRDGVGESGEEEDGEGFLASPPGACGTRSQRVSQSASLVLAWWRHRGRRVLLRSSHSAVEGKLASLVAAR